jgi:hypothetical protein
MPLERIYELGEEIVMLSLGGAQVMLMLSDGNETFHDARFVGFQPGAIVIMHATQPKVIPFQVITELEIMYV